MESIRVEVFCTNYELVAHLKKDISIDLRSNPVKPSNFIMAITKPVVTHVIASILRVDYTRQL